MDPCPPTRVLEEFAAGACADERVGSHVERCAECHAAVEESRENNNFLAGVRTALAAHDAKASLEATPESTDAGMVAGYQIQEELHRGGQGVVYRAVQTRTRRTVAIKMLLSGRRATGRQKERFEREIRIAAGLRHPNIVAVHDSGYISDGRYGLVMEYIEGVPLDQWSRGLDVSRGREARRAALRTRLGVVAKVCDAVLCAHQHSIVHRDLKPANILVDAAGEPHILDFGIARDTGPEQRTRLTHTGEFAGTLAYASPEQVSGDLSRVDTRTDIYSLGVIMYELVSGRMPYAVDGPMSQVLRNIESAEPAPLHRRSREPDAPWADGEVSTIILKALAKDPDRRYPTAAGLRNDITRYLAGEAIDARRDSTWYVVRKAAARHRVVVAATGLIFLLLAAFGAAMAWQAHRLDIRGTELASALSASNVERGRSLAAAGQTPLAEDVIFPELIAAGVKQIDGSEVRFAGSPEALHAYWGLWDVFRSSRCVVTLRTRNDAKLEWPEIRLLYFDEGGQRLNAVGSRGELTSWSVATWETVRDTSLFAPIEGAEYLFNRAPDGNIAVFGGGLIRVIDPETGRVVAQADDSDHRVRLGTFSPDSRLIATGGRGNVLCVRDAGTLEVVVTLAGSGDGKGDAPPWSRPIFSPDGSRIAAARDDGALGVWDATSGALERTTRPPAAMDAAVGNVGHVGVIAFAPDGTIVSSWAVYHLVVWPADGSAPRGLSGSGGLIARIEYLPGSNYRQLVLTGSSPGGGGGVTAICDLETGARVATYKHPDDCVALATSPDGRLLVVGMTNGMVQVYDAAQEPHVTALQADRGWPFPKMALSPDGRRLALTTSEPPESEQDVVVIDVKTRATIRRFRRTGPDITAIEFGRDGLSLFESDRSGRVRQWDLDSDTCVREFVFPEPRATEPRLEPKEPGAGGTNQLRLSPDGRILARARDDGLIGLWDVPSGVWIGVLDSGTSGYAVIDFSHDGRTLVAQHAKVLVLWDVQTRRPRRTISVGNDPNAVRCSPTGPVIAVSASGQLQFLDAETGRVISTCPPGTAGIGMAFQREAEFFASAFDSSIRLWDSRTGRELLALRKHTQVIREFVVTPDGNTLISSDWMGTVLVWDLTYYNDRIRRELANRMTRAGEP